jgi:biopolymer transport protein ExbD
MKTPAKIPEIRRIRRIPGVTIFLLALAVFAVTFAMLAQARPPIEIPPANQDIPFSRSVYRAASVPSAGQMF